MCDAASDMPCSSQASSGGHRDDVLTSSPIKYKYKIGESNAPPVEEEAKIPA